jgi:carbon starvation protein
VLIGGLFIVAVHDYLAAYMSIRHNGQSIATIARRLLGRGPFIALMLFLILMLGLVTAVFLNTSASALVSMLDFGRMKLDASQTVFRVVEDAGVQKVVIGGVASMSVIIITALAPLVGWMYIKKRVSVWKCSALATTICIVSILAGLWRPVAFPSTVHLLGLTLKGSDCWKLILGAYVLVAAGVPVWLFLQSRDFINVHILYVGIGLLLAMLVVASLRGAAPLSAEAIPALDQAGGTAKLGAMWPVLFITVACGAVSGFHSLCAGGTTCKQLKNESATRYIGYWGMLLETLLAVGVITIVVIGTTRAFYLDDVFPVGRDNNPVLGFAFAVGSAGHAAFGWPIAAGALAGMLLLEGFVITTLDTAVRLNRYLIEEIWMEFFGRFDVFAHRSARFAAAAGEGEAAGSCAIPSAIELPEESPPSPQPAATRGLFRGLLRLLSHYWVNSGLAVALMLWLSFSGGILQLWKIFGTANQLLAAFVLSIGAIWLLRSGKRVWYIVAPAVFMLVTTTASLILLLRRFMPGVTPEGKPAGNATLLGADAVLLALTVYLIAVGIRELLKSRTRAAPSVA